MNFVGIIAEYDPFHSGHALQLRMLRQRGASTIAVCMSTGVVQRSTVNQKSSFRKNPMLCVLPHLLIFQCFFLFPVLF